MLLHLLFSYLLGASLLLSVSSEELRVYSLEERPIKVCGRDFVRLLIAICGKPRGKRPRRQEPEQMFISGGNDVENGKLDPEVIRGWKEGQIPQLNQGQGLLKNMFSLYAHTEDSTPTIEDFMMGSEESKGTVEKNKNEIKAINPLEQSDFVLKTRLREKRFWTSSLAERCCFKTCTKNDMARIC